MHKLESIQEKDTHKILWDIGIHTDHLISVWRQDLEFIKKNKRTCHLGDFAVAADHRVKMKESEKIDKYYYY